MTTGIIHSEQNLEKQIEKHMGSCMAGFFGIFDRNHILSSSSHQHRNKRLTSPLLPPPQATDSSASDYSSGSPSPSSRSGEIIVKPSPPPPTQSAHSPTLKPVRALSKPDSPKSPGIEVGALAKSTSPWKFTRDAPRLSLDSRAVVDAKGKLHPRQIRTPPPAADREEYESDRQRRSPSVVARLMGLDNLPSSTTADSPSETRGATAAAALRRSASESRSRDLLPLHCRLFIDGGSGNSNGGSASTTTAAAYQQNGSSGARVLNGEDNVSAAFNNYPRDFNGFNARTSSGGDGGSGFGWSGHSSVSPVTVTKHNNNSNHHYYQGKMTTTAAGQIHRKGFYDSSDFFPDPKPQATTASSAVYSEIEKRLRMSGIDEPCRDLETLKQILEALKLKGLLHSSTNTATTKREDRSEATTATRYHHDESPWLLSPIVVMKPVRAPPPVGRFRARTTGESPPGRNAVRSPVGSPSLLADRNDKGLGMGLSLATKKRMNSRTGGVLDQQQQEGRSGGVSSPVPSPRMVRGSGRMEMVGGSKRGRRRQGSEVFAARSGEEKVRRGREEDESENSCSWFNTAASTEAEISGVVWDEYRDGKSLLARCDKLLHSIAEMNTNNNNNSLSELQQPSPVSVLDSTFYKEDEEESPSPVMKRRTVLHFKDQLQEDEESSSSPSSSSIPDPSPLFESPPASKNTELNYISEILRALTNVPDDPYSDLFQMLENRHHHHKSRDTSTARRRLLLFDATTEILDRNQQLPPWTSSSSSSLSVLAAAAQPEAIWSEIQRLEETATKKDGSSSDEYNLFETVCRVMERDLAEADSTQGWKGCHAEVSEAVLGIERLVFKDLINEAIRDLGVVSATRTVGVFPRRRLVF